MDWLLDPTWSQSFLLKVTHCCVLCSICRRISWGGVICQGGRTLLFQINCFLQIETPGPKTGVCSQSHSGDRGAGQASRQAADKEVYRLRITPAKHTGFGNSLLSDTRGLILIKLSLWSSLGRWNAKFVLHVKNDAFIPECIISYFYLTWMWMSLFLTYWKMEKHSFL